MWLLYFFSKDEQRVKSWAQSIEKEWTKFGLYQIIALKVVGSASIYKYDYSQWKKISASWIEANFHSNVAVQLSKHLRSFITFVASQDSRWQTWVGDEKQTLFHNEYPIRLPSFQLWDLDYSSYKWIMIGNYVPLLHSLPKTMSLYYY